MVFSKIIVFLLKTPFFFLWTIKLTFFDLCEIETPKKLIVYDKIFTYMYRFNNFLTSKYLLRLFLKFNIDKYVHCLLNDLVINDS